MSKEAKPSRYLVDRRGTPDPEASEYFVLDVVHDFQARIALAGLVNRYRSMGSSVAADELEALLRDTNKAHIATYAAKEEALTGKKRATSGRTARRRR